MDDYILAEYRREPKITPRLVACLVVFIVGFGGALIALSP